MNSDPAGAHLELRQAVREFATAVIKPLAPRTDHEHRYPREALDAAAELDLMGILIPPEYGGAGLDHLAFAICIEEIATACASTAVLVDVHNSVASEPILLFGSEGQKRAWLPRLARGEMLGAFALTEPSSGSDAASLKTSAKRYGEEFVLSGTKVFITGVGEAGMYLVFARTDPDQRGAAGVSCFIVPGDAPGLKVGQVFQKMGLNGSPTGELVLEEVREVNLQAFQQLHSYESKTEFLQRQVVSTEERYRNLFDQASEGIVIAEAQDLEILELNQTAKRLLGIAGADTNLLSSFCQIHPEPQPPPRSGPEGSLNPKL